MLPTLTSAYGAAARADPLFNSIPLEDDYPYGTVPSTASSSKPMFQPSCDWTLNATARAVYIRHFGETTAIPLIIDPKRRSVRRAHVLTCNEPYRRGLIAGPFATRPGEWISFGAIFDLLSRGDRVIRYIGDVVDAHGRTVPFPPMHMHHIHFKMGSAIHWFETHGDYINREGLGYETRVPAGHCSVHHGTPTSVEAQVNDVRGAGHFAMSGDEESRPAAKTAATTPRMPTSGAMSLKDADVAAAAAEMAGSAAGDDQGAPSSPWYLRIVVDLSRTPCEPVSVSATGPAPQGRGRPHASPVGPRAPLFLLPTSYLLLSTYYCRTARSSLPASLQPARSYPLQPATRPRRPHQRTLPQP